MMFEKLTKKSIIIIFAIIFVVLPLGRINAIDIVYNEREVAFVRSLFDNNKLIDSKADRENISSWGSFVDWKIINQSDGSQLRRIQGLRLTDKKMKGTIIIDTNSGLDQLTTLNCALNQLNKLEISNLPLLETVSCYGNELEELKISNTPNYQKLECWNNQLTDLSNAMPSTVLSCSNNPLKDLDLSKTTSLVSVYCSDNQLSNLNITMLKNLENLNCSNNNLTELNFTNNLKLKTLSIGNDLQVGQNYFESVNISMLKELEIFSCLSTGLKKLNYLGLTKLKQLNVGKNGLTSLDVSTLAELIGLQCYSNKLEDLNLKGLDKLESVLCYNNKLTSLNLEEQVNLKTIDCSNNKITELKLPDTKTLNSINLEYNQLTSIDLSKYNITVIDFFNTRDGIRGINNNPLDNFKISDKEYQSKVNNGKIEVLGYKYSTGEITIKAVGDNTHKFKEWKLSSNIEILNGDINSETITFILPSGTSNVEALMVNDDASLKSLSYQIGDSQPIDITDLNSQKHIISLPRTVKPNDLITITGQATSDEAIIEGNNSVINLESGKGSGTLSVISASGKRINYFITFQIEQLQPDVDNEGKIEGIVNEGNYQQKEDLNAEVMIVENSDGVIIDGDIRYVPDKWYLKEKPEINGSWDVSPYILNIKDLPINKYTLVVEYQGQIYKQNDYGVYQWSDLKECRDQKEVKFKINESTYNLTIVSGNGTGEYKTNAEVEISANQLRDKEFDYWKIISGEGQIKNLKSIKTIFIMGDSDVIVEAVYKEIKNEVPTPPITEESSKKTGDINTNSWYVIIFISLLGIIFYLKTDNIKS
ncbi:MAG: InlB B-repeat-containing protein [Thomasclavelia sp.]|uniref:InlB B-repeat-containing protein n=1 Tax=Thomasclavelia sp. TaxID=3025757 RepID=UPI0039A03AED